MANLSIRVELFNGSTWNDIVTDDGVLADSPIVITRGQGDEGNAPRPDTVTMRLNNDKDIYRDSNPLSPLYGLAGRNTPLRVKVGGVIRGTVEASSWQTGQSNDFRKSPKRGKAWTDFQGGGLLQRVNGWTEPLHSPFYRYNIGMASSRGYWPCEDPRGATTLFTPTAGATSWPAIGVSFNSARRFSGSDGLAELKVSPTTSMGGNFIRGGDPASTTKWQFSWTGIYPTRPTAGLLQEIQEVWMTNGNSVSVLFDGPSNLRLFVADGASNTLADLSFNAGGTDFNRWNLFILDCTQVAGTCTLGLYWMTEDSPGFFFFTETTYTSNSSSLDFWRVGAGASSADTAIGHVVGVHGTGDNLLLGNRVNAFVGYAGETAADRIDRLCFEKSLTLTTVGTAAASWPMGPQPIDSFPKVLDECLRTEDALLTDDIDAIGLVLTTRAARYNQTPALALTPTDLMSLPNEVTDDLGIHNIVTASQKDGGDFTLSRDTGPVSTQSPPNGVGEARHTIEVNVEGEVTDLPVLAGWWLNRWTVELPRFPQLTVDLTNAHSSLITAAEAVGVGSVITLTGMREYVIRLRVLGYTERISWPIRRTITFTCAPDRQFQVGQWDSTSSLWDLKSSFLSAAVGVGVTSMTLTTSSVKETWSSASAYDLLISGELVGVPVGGMGARAGTGPFTQVLTGAVRGKNGINKILPAGSRVHVATPGRWAL